MQKRAHVHVQFCSIYDVHNINWQWAILHIKEYSYPIMLWFNKIFFILSQDLNFFGRGKCYY